MRFRIALFIFLCSWVLLTATSGCVLLRSFKADAADDAGFLPQPELLSEMTERSPFNRSWVVEDIARYTQAKLNHKGLSIKPVSTLIVEQQIEAGDSSERTKRIIKEEAQELAKYFYARLMLDLKDYPIHPLMIREAPSDDTFVLHLALVEINPTNPYVNAVGTAAGVFVPGGGLVKVFGKGSIAFEGFIKDGATGELMEQFKDRELDKAAPFTIKDFQRFAHLRVAIDDWSKQIVEILATPVEHKVDDSLPFSLNPF